MISCDWFCGLLYCANLIVSKYLCLVLTMEIYFNHKCVILLLPWGSHSIVGPARVALKRVKPQPIWMDAKQIIECLLWRKNEPSYRIWGWLSHARAGREGKKLGRGDILSFATSCYKSESEQELFVNDLPGWVAWRLGIARPWPETLQCNVACLVWRRIEHT